jgi:hypothetical protein
VCKTQNENLLLNLLNITTTLNELDLSLVIQNELDCNNIRIQNTLCFGISNHQREI